MWQIFCMRICCKGYSETSTDANRGEGRSASQRCMRNKAVGGGWSRAFLSKETTAEEHLSSQSVHLHSAALHRQRPPQTRARVFDVCFLVSHYNRSSYSQKHPTPPLSLWSICGFHIFSCSPTRSCCCVTPLPPFCVPRCFSLHVFHCKFIGSNEGKRNIGGRGPG